ncbi:MAG: extracellular solute-binding protein [Clostridia bacterium]|nr:extracellular solute-binding protein [Clostridia bacterium]
MKKTITKVLAIMFVIAMAVSAFAGCSTTSKEKVVIWTSGEDYKNEFYLTECQKKFPEYEIELIYMSSSDIAAKVIEEGDKCSADLIISEEYNYLEKCSDYLAVLSDFDYSVFLDAIVPASKKYTPELKNGGCVIVNTKVLADKGIEEPTSYEDLLKPEFKGLLSMPSPKSSGTGYMFLRQLTNEWGEDKAFEYFDKFTENVLQYTSSGSGPVKALEAREVAVGLGMTSQAVEKITKGNDELKILFFEEGSPYSMYGNAVLKKSADRKAVMDVFNYLATDLCKADNEKYFPDQIYKNFAPEKEGFPTGIKYGNMSNDTQAEKERLLEKWTH